MQPYFKDRKIEEEVVVTCGRCESSFLVKLKKRKDFPIVTCPKCKVENRFQIVWK